ncbi:cytochrome P450 [Biscogniauxia marginata]|nr:cytochrome P450 [Biscogniauxia marginata]
MAPLLSTIMSVSYTQATLAAFVSFVLYTIIISIYRLFFHPLRNVPGPRLAALTQWVETYYECFKSPGGQFMWEYRKWHEQYGPIVRISPNEVHIQDPTFYETLFAQSRHSDKLKHLETRFSNELSAFATADHNFHRVRRGALNPFFSKRKIAQHSPNIQNHMNRLCSRVASQYLGSDATLNLTSMWGAFAADIVVGYCLEKPYDFIMNPGFRAEFCDAMVDLLNPVHFNTQFPWMLKPIKLLPDSLVKNVFPPMRSVIEYRSEMESQILRAKAVHASGEKKLAATPSLFTALLESDLPPAELSTKRLQHEAISIIAAGIETTMWCLSACSYHLLANPTILEKLKAELVAAIPDPDRIPDLDSLMQLPYLTNVIDEALRFTYGTSQRTPRLSPTPIVYSSPDTDYVLPVGSVVSMDNYSVSHDPWLFPDSYEFRPERWEGSPRAPDGKPLKRYLVSFGRGTRSCVGMQMAYADLYIGLASFFRRFNCELFETERDAVDLYMDCFMPRAKPGTKGVRVKVLKTA